MRGSLYACHQRRCRLRQPSRKHVSIISYITLESTKWELLLYFFFSAPCYDILCTKPRKGNKNKYGKRLVEAKVFYASLEAILCPALNNERIVFNAHGIKHLIRKGRILRSQVEQLRRFRLLKYILPTLSDPVLNPACRSEELSEEIKYNNQKLKIRRKAIFWTFEKFIIPLFRSLLCSTPRHIEHSFLGHG
jgi:hypothetical protein